MPQQLTFDLPVRTALGRDEFFIAPANAAALAALDGEWAMNRLLLTGPKGCGKTHLASIWAAEQGGALISASDLPDRLPSFLDIPDLPIAIEDIDRLAGDPRGEEALFHIINARPAPAGRLLLTAGTLPPQCGFTLPDLVSRLMGTQGAAMDPPDDALLAAVFVKLFGDRQLTPDPKLIAYLLTRTERSFAGAQSLVAQLDRAALTSKKKLTADLARRVLDKPAPPTA